MKLMNEGKQYELLIDPLLGSVHAAAVRLVPEGSTVIDIACGNGTLAIKTSSKARHITGIDLSSEMISYATDRAEKQKRNNIEFLQMDASDLSAFQENEFDYATISMAIHQFERETGLAILKEVSRIADNIIVIDYNFPLPGGYKGFVTRLIERIAGVEHNNNFEEYLQFGGMNAIAEACGLEIKTRRGGRKSVFTVVHCV